MIVVGAAICWAVGLWLVSNARPSPAVRFRAEATTGCGELVVEGLTIELWGVEIDDCAGANAVLEREIVEREREFLVQLGHCMLHGPGASPRWSCTAKSTHWTVGPQQEPLAGPLPTARIRAVPYDVGHPYVWSAQQELLRAGAAHVSADCIAALDAAMINFEVPWPGACARLWGSQCFTSEQQPECHQRYRDPNYAAREH